MSPVAARAPTAHTTAQKTAMEPLLFETPVIQDSSILIIIDNRTSKGRGPTASRKTRQEWTSPSPCQTAATGSRSLFRTVVLMEFY